MCFGYIVQKMIKLTIHRESDSKWMNSVWKGSCSETEAQEMYGLKCNKIRIKIYKYQKRHVQNN